MVAKKSAAKKPVTKKPVAKKTVKKVVHKRAASKIAPMKSFRVYGDVKPFMTFKVTKQTVYWAILLVFVIVTQLMILKIQLDIAVLTSSLIAR